MSQSRELYALVYLAQPTEFADHPRGESPQSRRARWTWSAAWTLESCAPRGAENFPGTLGERRDVREDHSIRTNHPSNVR